MYDDATNEQSGVKPSNSYNSYNYTNYNYSDDKTYNGDLSGKSVYGYGNENRAYGSYQYSNTGNAMNNGMQRPPRKKTGLKVVVSLVVVFAILSGVGIGGYLFHTFKHNVKVTTEKVEQTTAEASTEATQAVTQNDQNKVAATVSGEVKATVTDVTGVVTLPADTEMCMPGDNVAMDVELITPIAIEEGLRFAIREGGRTVGSGVVTKINE